MNTIWTFCLKHIMPCYISWLPAVRDGCPCASDVTIRSYWKPLLMCHFQLCQQYKF